MKQSRASNHQFFNSQSSFGSQSKVSSSRINEMTQQILEDSQTVFISLQKQLKPLQSETDLSKIDIIYNRARILLKESIPEQINFLKKLTQNQTSNTIYLLQNSQDKLSRFVIDYQDWRVKQNLQFKQFYKRYSPQGNSNFKKKDGAGQASGVPINIFHNQATDIVQIVQQRRYHGSGFKNASNKFALNQSRQSQGSSNKEKKIRQLYDQISRLKKQQQQQRRYYQLQINNQKSNSQKRINQLLKMRWNDSLRRDSDDVIMLKTQLFACQQKLQIEYLKNQQRHKIVTKLQKQISDLKHQKSLLIEDLESHKRLQNSRMSEAQSQGGKSVRSEYDIPKGDVKKLEKMVKNLIYEKNILRNQLNKQRQLNYNIKNSNLIEQQQQIDKLNKLVDKLTKQKNKIYADYDRVRVQSIKIRQNDRMTGKMIETLKNQNETLKNVGISQPHFKIGYSPSHKSGKQDILSVSSYQNNKPMIAEYDGDGIQGYPYYQLLNKQFRIRFRRSCLKQKQLLHKANGLQIGIISEFLQPNEIKILLHFTNYSDSQFKDIKLKIMNPNDNKINFEKDYLQNLKIGEQFKIPVYVTVKFYPIGPVILVCQYLNNGTGKKEELRILLPVHSYKMMTILPRQKQQLKKKQTIRLKVQKKIARDFNSLCSYFKGAKIISGQSLIKAEVHHGHTNTTTFLDLKLKGEQLDISYQSVTGSQKITDYFAKTLAFLFSK